MENIVDQITVTNESTNVEMAKYIGAMTVANKVRDILLEEMKRKEFKDCKFEEELFNALGHTK